MSTINHQELMQNVNTYTKNVGDIFPICILLLLYDIYTLRSIYCM